MATRVLITIDTEFSIGGAFEQPGLRSPVGQQNVLFDVDGKSEGLGFMLETFSRFGIRATFFVETLQTAYFGDSPMAALAHRIANSGHDVELHLHPVWTYFDRQDWIDRLARECPVDNCHGQTVDQLVTWIERGRETLVRWGLPDPVALRTGNMMVDSNVYRAMDQVGMRLASNIGRGVFEPNEPQLRLNSGVHTIHGVTEVPVLSYSSIGMGGWSALKLLTITGSTFEEMKYVIEAASLADCQSVVLLTHCHEFARRSRNGVAANRCNQDRLVELCSYLGNRSGEFEVCTMRDMRDHVGRPDRTAPPLTRVPAVMAAKRIVENFVCDRVGS